MIILPLIILIALSILVVDKFPKTGDFIEGFWVITVLLGISAFWHPMLFLAIPATLGAVLYVSWKILSFVSASLESGVKTMTCHGQYTPTENKNPKNQWNKGE